MSEDRRIRVTARTVVVDDLGRALLFQVLDPLDDNEPCWLTPGGGVRPGESLPEAAARELSEETGLVVPQEELGAPIAVCRGPWVFRGTPLFQEDWYFTISTTCFDPDESGWEPLEVDLHQGWHWWSAEELMVTDDLVFPGELHTLIDALARGEQPRQPIFLPWPLD